MKALHSPLAVTLVIAIATTPFLGLAQSSGAGASPAGSASPAPAPIGSAAPDAKKEEAAVRYQRGIELYKEENYKAALVEFRKAYELTNAYRVLYNIGQVCYQLQDYVCAVSSFEQYLQKGGTEINETRREEVDREVKKLRPRIAEVSIVANADGVMITVDDVPRGKTPLPPILLNAGTHRLTATKEGKVPITQSFDVAGADKPTIKIELVDLAGKQVVVRERVGETSKWTGLSYAGLGLGGAMLIGAGVTGFLALGAASDLKNERYVGEPSASALSLQSRVKSFRLATDILAVAGLVTLTTTLVLTLSRKTETGSVTTTTAVGKPTNVSVGLGFGSVLFQGEF